MKITINNHQVLQIEAQKPEEKSLEEQLKNYRLKLNGSILEVEDLNNNKLLYCDLVDNTVFVVSSQPEAFVMANILGSKRFILSSSYPPNLGVQFYPRDRDFNLNVTTDAAPTFQFLVGLDTIKAAIPENVLYRELALLYKNYANFLESKIQEYSADEVADKYCRYNSPPVTPIVMINSAKQIIGSIRLCSIPIANGVSVYLSDEVVRYANPDERPILMSQLFEGVRQILRQVPNLKDAFIRVASGREPMYQSLGCSATTSHIPVIHGQPTDLMNAIKNVVKEAANNKLLKITTPVSSIGFHKAPAALPPSVFLDVDGTEWCSPLLEN